MEFQFLNDSKIMILESFKNLMIPYLYMCTIEFYKFYIVIKDLFSVYIHEFVSFFHLFNIVLFTTC